MIKLFRPSRIITHDENVKVVREGEVIYFDGKPIKRNITEFNLVCNVQPLGGKDLLLVPELDRLKEMYFLWTNELDKPLFINDRIVRETLSFQVQTIEQWGSYQKARIVLIDVGPNSLGPNAEANKV